MSEDKIPFRHHIANFVVDYWTDISLPIFAMITSAAFFGFTDEAIKYWSSIDDVNNQIFQKYKYWTTLIIIVTIVLTIVTLVFHIIKQESISKLRKANRDLKADRDLVRNDLSAVINGYLYGIVENLEFQETDRVTIYSHDDKFKHFVPFNRISQNPELDKHGRNAYPDNQGYIGKTWREGKFFIDSLPEWKTNEAEYIKIMKRENFPKGLHKTLRMKSRLFFGWRINDSKDQKPLAILMIESTEPNRWTEEQLTDYFVQEKKKFCNIFERVHKHFPEFSEAREKGF